MWRALPDTISFFKEFCLDFLLISPQVFSWPELSLLLFPSLLTFPILLFLKFFSFFAFWTKTWDGGIREENQLIGDKDIRKKKPWVCPGVSLYKSYTDVKENKKSGRPNEAGEGQKQTGKVSIDGEIIISGGLMSGSFISARPISIKPIIGVLIGLRPIDMGPNEKNW